jgi:hypothetical protein
MLSRLIRAPALQALARHQPLHGSPDNIIGTKERILLGREDICQLQVVSGFKSEIYAYRYLMD